MELQEAIERLREKRNEYKKFIKNAIESDVDFRHTAFEDALIERKLDVQAIDTILKELNQAKANLYIANNIINELKSEMTAKEFLEIRDMECLKYEECNDKCKFRRRGECVALCRIAVQIAKEIKEEK